MFNFIKKEIKTVIVTLILIMTIIAVTPTISLAADQTPTIEITGINGDTTRKTGKVVAGDKINLSITDDKSVQKKVWYIWNEKTSGKTVSGTLNTTATKNPTTTLTIPSDVGTGLLQLSLAVSDESTATNYEYTPFYIMSNATEINNRKFDTVGPIVSKKPESGIVKIGEDIVYEYSDNAQENGNSGTGIYKIIYKWVDEASYIANDYKTNAIAKYGPSNRIVFNKSTKRIPTKYSKWRIILSINVCNGWIWKYQQK